jgi:hypothetical protein
MKQLITILGILTILTLLTLRTTEANGTTNDNTTTTATITTKATTAQTPINVGTVNANGTGFTYNNNIVTVIDNGNYKIRDDNN